MKHLKPEQVGKLIAQAEGDRNRLLFSLLYQHGMRISECLALTKGSERRGYLRIRPKKNGKPSDERMAPDTLALWGKVCAVKLPHVLVFDGISRQWCSVLFHRYCERAQIELQPRQGLHSLRHSLAHAMLDAGSPLPVVQKALRHRSIGSTGVYLEADNASVDVWRSKAVGGPCAAVAQVPAALSLAEIRREIARLSKLAAMQDEAEKRGAMQADAMQADAPQPAPAAMQHEK